MNPSFVESMRPSLLTLLRARPGSDDAALALRRFSTYSERDWEALTLCAGHHGVLGVVLPALSAHAVLPQTVADQAERRLAIDQLWQAHLRTGLESAVGILTSAAIPVCALKGPVLAARLYPEGTTRHCLDVDLLVRPEHYEAARAAMIGAGYEAEGGPTAAYLEQHSHAIGFSRSGTAPVELHFHAYAGFGVVLPAATLMSRATPYSFGSISVLAPSPEDEFIYLAVHAAGHSFIRLVWLFDLKRLVEQNPDLDWTAIADRSAALGVRSAVGYTTRVLDRWLGVKPPNLPSSLGRATTRSKAADRLLAEVSRPQATSMRDNLGGLLFTSLLCDRLSSGAWLVQHHVARSARRKMKALAPAFLPERWSA